MSQMWELILENAKIQTTFRMAKAGFLTQSLHEKISVNYWANQITTVYLQALKTTPGDMPRRRRSCRYTFYIILCINKMCQVLFYNACIVSKFKMIASWQYYQEAKPTSQAKDGENAAVRDTVLKNKKKICFSCFLSKIWWNLATCWLEPSTSESPKNREILCIQ